MCIFVVFFQTSIYCAVDPTLEGESGKYYSDCGEKEPMPQAKDDQVRFSTFAKEMSGKLIFFFFLLFHFLAQVARQLWEISEKVVGLK